MGVMCLLKARGDLGGPSLAARFAAGVSGASALVGLGIVEGSGIVDTLGTQIRIRPDSSGVGRATLVYSFPSATGDFYNFLANVDVVDDTEDVRVCAGLVRGPSAGSLAQTLMSSNPGDTTYTNLGIVTGGLVEVSSGISSGFAFRKNSGGTPSITPASPGPVPTVTSQLVSLCPCYVDEISAGLTAGEFCFGAFSNASVPLASAFRAYVNDVEVAVGAPQRSVGVIQVEAIGGGGGADVRVNYIGAVGLP